MTDGLAKALHKCEAYLPLFIEDGPKLRGAIAVHDQTQEALEAYCELVGIDRQELHRWTCE